MTIPNIPHLVRATMTLNGDPIISGTMGAFSGNELRGKTVISSEKSACLLTVNISGVNEQISFRYWDGMREHKVTSTLTAASDGESSITLSFTYTPESVAPPIFQPVSTHYSTDSLRVELSSKIPDAVITYATNASMQNAIRYTEPFYITGTQTIYAQAASFGISSVITSVTYTYNEKQPAVDPNFPKAEVAVGSDVPVNKEDFGVESLTSKNKLSATYDVPFQTEKTKKLLVKMTPDGNAFEVKGSVKLTNAKVFNALKKDQFTLDILMADSVLQQVQKESVVVEVGVDLGKKKTSDSTVIVALVPARLDSVIIVSAHSTDSAKMIQYAIVVGSGFSTKPKCQIEYMHDGKIKRLSAPLQKETKYPAEVKTAISALTVGIFFLETTEMTVFKLSKKCNAINGRRDIVIDNKNGLSAETLRY